MWAVGGAMLCGRGRGRGKVRGPWAGLGLWAGLWASCWLSALGEAVGCEAAGCVWARDGAGQLMAAGRRLLVNLSALQTCLQQTSQEERVRSASPGAGNEGVCSFFLTQIRRVFPTCSAPGLFAECLRPQGAARSAPFGPVYSCAAQRTRTLAFQALVRGLSSFTSPRSACNRCNRVVEDSGPRVRGRACPGEGSAGRTHLPPPQSKHVLGLPVFKPLKCPKTSACRSCANSLWSGVFFS